MGCWSPVMYKYMANGDGLLKSRIESVELLPTLPTLLSTLAAASSKQ